MFTPGERRGRIDESLDPCSDGGLNDVTIAIALDRLERIRSTARYGHVGRRDHCTDTGASAREAQRIGQIAKDGLDTEDLEASGGIGLADDGTRAGGAILQLTDRCPAELCGCPDDGNLARV